MEALGNAPPTPASRRPLRFSKWSTEVALRWGMLCEMLDASLQLIVAGTKSGVVLQRIRTITS